MGYQSTEDELDIVGRRALADIDSTVDEVTTTITRRAVLVTRGTRHHGDVRVGSSVRGAIDLVEVADRLGRIRASDAADPAVGLDAALVALSGRIRLQEGGDRSPEDVITDLWQQVLAAEQPRPEADGDDAGKAAAL